MAERKVSVENGAGAEDDAALSPPFICGAHPNDQEVCRSFPDDATLNHAGSSARPGFRPFW